MTQLSQPTPRPALIFIIITIVIMMLGVGIAWPILPKLIQQFEGGNIADAAFSYAILAVGFALAQFVFQPIAGALSDHFGRKPVILLSLAGVSLDYLLIAFAPDLIWMGVARVIGGIFSATVSVANAYIADVSKPEERSRNFGLIGAAFGFGFIVGPLLGGFLGEINLHLPFIIAAVLAFANLVFGFIVLPESLEPKNRKAFSLKTANPFSALSRVTRFSNLRPLLITLFLVDIGQRGIEAIWVLYTGFRFKWGVMESSLSLAFVGAMFVLVQGFLVGPVVKYFGEWKVVAAGFTLSSVALFLSGLAYQGWMVFPLISFHILGNALAIPALVSICSNAAPDNEQGLVQGTISSIKSVSIIIGPFFASMMLAYVARPNSPIHIPGAWFILASLLVMIGASITMVQIATRKI